MIIGNEILFIIQADILGHRMLGTKNELAMILLTLLFFCSV